MKEGSSQICEDIASFIDAHLRFGFESKENVVEGARDLFGSDEGYPGDVFVERAVRDALAALIQEQETWQRPTDAERLDRAFRELEEMGILARHCYAPTRTWGLDDLNEEAAIARSRGAMVRGYVFYTSQDAESLLDGQLNLAWGVYSEPGRTFAQGMAAADEVANTVVSVLSRVGLHPHWDGARGTTILLNELDWRHPRDPETGHFILPTERRYRGSNSDAAQTSPEALGLQHPHPVTADGEWLVRIAYLSNTSDNGPFANLWHIHNRTNLDVPTNARLNDFSPERTFAFDFVPLALAPIAGRSTRFDLVAPPTSFLYPTVRVNLASQTDGIVLVPTDIEALTDMMERLQNMFGDGNFPSVIQLNTDIWDEADIAQIEAAVSGGRHSS